MPTEATVAHVLVGRYADHLPLYRRSQILLLSPKLFADETPMPVLDSGRV